MGPLLLLLLVMSACAQVFVPVPIAWGDRRIFPRNTPIDVSLSFSMRPCADAESCKRDCGAIYCSVRKEDLACTGNLNATWSVQLSIPYACCDAADPTCANPVYGGSYLVNDFHPILLEGLYGDCDPVPAQTVMDWQQASRIRRGTLCANSDFVMPLFAENTIAPSEAIAAASLLNTSSESPAVALYFALVVSVNPGSEAPTPFPEARVNQVVSNIGVVPTGVQCGIVEAKLKEPAAAAQGIDDGCIAECGCLWVGLKGRTYIVEGSRIKTEFKFDVCALCKDFPLAYLSFCDFSGASGVLVDSIAPISGRYCDFELDSGQCSPLAPCSSRCWVATSVCKKFSRGRCDEFTVLVDGATDDLVFDFYAKTHEDGVVQKVNISLKTCPASTAPPCPIASKTYGTNCDQCLFPPTQDQSVPSAYCVPVDGGRYMWTLLPFNDPVPQGAFRPGSVDPATGFSTNCACEKIIVPCTPACTTSSGDSDDDDNNDAACLCNSTVGTCRTDPVCASTVPSCPSPNAACPSGPLGVCNGNGACVCGQCVCTSNNGVVWSGAACDVPNDCSRFNTCFSCALSNCSWCQTGTGGLCLSSDVCSNIGGHTWSCDNMLLVSSGGCLNDCACNGVSHGNCKGNQCTCIDNYAGTDCCIHRSPAAVNKGALAGGIIGGIAAAVVIVLIVVLVATGYCVKAGMNWARIGHLVAAARDNPLAEDAPRPASQTAESAAAATTGTATASEARQSVGESVKEDPSEMSASGQPDP